MCGHYRQPGPITAAVAVVSGAGQQAAEGHDNTSHRTASSILWQDDHDCHVQGNRGWLWAGQGQPPGQPVLPAGGTPAACAQARANGRDWHG